MCGCSFSLLFCILSVGDNALLIRTLIRKVDMEYGIGGRNLLMIDNIALLGGLVGQFFSKEARRMDLIK